MPDVLSTGSLALDCALWTGGWPRGHIVEVFGAEAAAKSTLAMLAAREAQRAGGEAVYVDADRTLDPKAAARVGVDLDRLLFCRPETGENAVDIARRMLCTGSVTAVIFDSVAALVPQVELRGGEAPPGAHRKLVTRAFQELEVLAAEHHALVIAVNRIQHVPGRAPREWVERTTGGEALPSRASIRVRLLPIEVGPRTRVRVVVEKNLPQASPPGTATEVVLGDMGVARAADLLVAAYDAGVIVFRDRAFWFGDDALGGSPAAAVAVLHGHMGDVVRAAVLARAPWRRGLQPLPTTARVAP